MGYVDQVRRLADALIFSLTILPNSVDNNEVKNVLTVLVEACQASYFMKNDYIYYSTLEEDKNFETESFEPDNLLEKNLDTIESKISKLTSVKIKKNYEACQLSNFIQTDKSNINSLDSSLEKVETQKTESSYPANIFETNLEVPENKLKENSIKGTKDNDENFEVKPKQKVNKSNNSKLSYKYHCIFCRKHFHTPEEQNEHDEVHHKDNDSCEYVCPEFDYTHDSKIEVMNHYGDSHETPSNIKYCFDCKQAFYKASDLRQHLKVLHNKEFPSESCLMCDESFPTYKKALYHMTTIHRNFMFQCPKSYCYKLFGTILELNVHSKSHKIPDILKCEYCGKEFAHLENAPFQRHVQSHSMEKNLQCPHCDKQFYFEIDLNQHVNYRHDLNFLCDKCEFKTYRKSTLDNHNIIKHTEHNEHFCNVCGKSFKLLRYLENHQETHSDERKYKCDICGKGFRNQKHLAPHKRIHLNDYRAQCKVCERKFIQKWNLKSHMKKHHPDISL